MKILNCLYYYRPHYSGLTVYTERLAKELAKRGHEMHILTSRYDQSLPLQAMDEGVAIERIPVAFRISKGPVMPTYVWTILRKMAAYDVIHVHIPQIAAAPVALWGRLTKKPVVLTYHCDLRLPPTFINRFINAVSTILNRIAILMADVVVTNTRDYAEHSQVLKHRLDKVMVIPPPIEVMPFENTTLGDLKKRCGVKAGQILIGMAARLATEKGAEYLAEAMTLLLEDFPQARVLYVGKYQGVMGEEDYAARLQPLLNRLGDHWMFLGLLSSDELSAFFHMCDVTVLPSINSTESFGMVQVESMLSGTPVVATDIPGVRCPIRETGMGRIVRPRDAVDLAQGIRELILHLEQYPRETSAVREIYGTEAVGDQYEQLFNQILRSQ